jgi:hypothetical protein
MSKNFSSISQVLSSSALEQKKHFDAILPRPGLTHKFWKKIFILMQ